jgi:circadian clock protein KaiB
MNRNDFHLGEKCSIASRWSLRLYVNGRSSLKTILTLQNLTEVCEKHLGSGFDLEVVDMAEDSSLGDDDQVLALPTLVRKSPQPVRKIVGDLSNTDQVVLGLGLPARDRTEL